MVVVVGGFVYTASWSAPGARAIPEVPTWSIYRQPGQLGEREFILLSFRGSPFQHQITDGND